MSRSTQCSLSHILIPLIADWDTAYCYHNTVYRLLVTILTSWWTLQWCYVKTRELYQSIGITPGSQQASRNCTLTHTPKMALSGDYHPPPPFTRGSSQMAGTKGRTRQTLKKGRRGRPPLSLKLSDTGISSLADKRWLGVAVNLNNATVGLLLWSLKQPPLPLSGGLYE